MEGVNDPLACQMTNTLDYRAFDSTTAHFEWVLDSVPESIVLKDSVDNPAV